MRNSSLQLYWLLLILLLPVFGGITLLLSLRTKDRVNREIIEGFDSKLSEIITLTDVFLDGEQHRKLARISDTGNTEQLTPKSYDPTDSFYLKSVEAFKQIRKATGLTYLYTLVLLDQNNLCYILDGSDPEYFSPIGTQDTLPANFYDEMKVSQKLDQPLIKPVEEWENWGLIKSGFISLHHGDRQSSGFIGADIAADIIQTREKHATLALMLSAVIGIIISIFAAIRSTRELARPIHQLKAAVMQLAGGNLESPFTAVNISEYARLARSYQTIQTAFIDLDRQNREIRERHRLKEVQSYYVRYLNSQLLTSYTARQAKLAIHDSLNQHSFSCIESANRIRLWQVLESTPDASMLSAKIGTIARRLISVSFGRWVEALQNAGYLGLVNLINIDYNTRQYAYALTPRGRIVLTDGTMLTGSSEGLPIPPAGDALLVIRSSRTGSTDNPESGLEIRILP